MSADRSPALIIRFAPGTTSETRDALSTLLADHDIAAIQEDDVSAPTAWTIHFTTPGARDAALTSLRAADALPLADPEVVDVEDEDWARRTQADLPAVRVGRIVVAPPWDLPPAPDRAGADAVVVVIEPSRGFGTGHHQSTRLCLVLLQSVGAGGRTVLDIGTGSGVLAIAAARLGAAHVSAIDSDPDAVENARENVARNGVAAIVDAHVRDLSESGLPPADLVLANLTGTLLARHADALAELVRPSGRLIVAGFTADESFLVGDAFLPRFETVEAAEEDGWEARVLARTS